MSQPNCSDFFDCEDPMSLEQALKNMIVKDENGCPVMKVKDSNAPGNITNDSLTPVLIEAADDTVTGLQTALASWISSNSSKKIVFIFNAVGNDGKTGYQILYK